MDGENSKSNWQLIQEAVIARATRLALDDVKAQFERGQFPEFHLEQSLQQAMREVEALLRSENNEPHSHEANSKGSHARDC